MWHSHHYMSIFPCSFHLVGWSVRVTTACMERWRQIMATPEMPLGSCEMFHFFTLLVFRRILLDSFNKMANQEPIKSYVKCWGKTSDGLEPLRFGWKNDKNMYVFAWFLVPRLQVISRWSKRILATFSFQFDQFDWRQQMKIIHHPPRPFLQGTCYAYGQSFHPKDRFFHFWVVGFFCSLVSRRPEQRNHLRYTDM